MASDKFKSKAKMINSEIGEPLGSMSKFYATYYLSEVEGLSEVESDFQYVKDQLYDTFWYYGIHSVSLEMSNIHSIYYYGDRLKNIPERDVRYFLGMYVSNDYTDLLNTYIEELDDIGYKTSKRQSEVADELEYMEEKFNALSRPERFLNFAKEIFTLPTFEEGPERMKEIGLDGWSNGYAGEGWSSICDHLLNRFDTPGTMWVDMSFSIEHNTGSWMNKVKYHERNRTVIEMALSHEQIMELTHNGIAASLSNLVQDVLEWLMDMNHEGEMWPIYDFAKYYDDDLAINIRDYKNYFSEDVISVEGGQ